MSEAYPDKNVTTLRDDVVPYDRDRHHDWVKSTWCWGARQSWPALTKLLARPEGRCVVAQSPDDPNVFYAWAAVLGPAVVWAYTRDWPDDRRCKGRMTNLLLLLGVDVSKPTPCLFWSPAAAQIAARGYRIYYAPEGAKEAA